MTFKTAIKAITKQFGRNQYEVADAIGMSGASISMSFKRNNPRLDTLVKLADELGCSVWIAPKQVKVASGWLLDGKDLPQVLSD